MLDRTQMKHSPNVSDETEFKVRPGEKVEGGFFVMKRGGRSKRIKTGYILAGNIPFEHPDLESATTEAARLCHRFGGNYIVLQQVTQTG